MASRRLLCPLALLAVPVLVFAGPSAETASLSAATGFSSALQIKDLVRFDSVPAQVGSGSSITGIQVQTLDAAPESAHRTLFRAAAFASPQQTIDLPGLLNRNLRAGLNVNLGGKDVWLSGVFDRGTYDAGKKAYVDPNAYVSLLIEGEAAVSIYNVRDLLSSPQTVTIGGGRFKLKLAPDLSDQLDSEIVIINLANNHKDRITLRDLLNAVGAAGASVTVGSQVYKLFYYDEVKNGRMDPASKLYAFIATDPKGGFHVFMIPGELVSSDATTSFKMLDDKPMGLRRAGEKLLVYANP